MGLIDKIYMILIFDPHWSLQVKSSSAAELTIYDFLLVSNSNKGAKSNGFANIDG